MNPEEKEDLRKNLAANGFNPEFPVFLYQEKVLEGWNRYQLCLDLGIEPVFKKKDEDFDHDDEKALEFVNQCNLRRNLSSSQKAALAVEFEDLIGTIKAQTEETRRRKQSETVKNNNSVQDDSEIVEAQTEVKQDDTQYVNGTMIETQTDETDESDNDSLIERTDEEQEQGDETNSDKEDESEDTTDETDTEAPPFNEHAGKTSEKVAQMFGTNRTYVNDATKLKKNNPGEFAKVKSGDKTLSQVKKEEKQKERTFFEEASSVMSEFPKVLRKLQTYIKENLPAGCQEVYSEITGFNAEKFEKLNSEIAAYLECRDCYGAGCDECENKGFIKPEEEIEQDAEN